MERHLDKIFGGGVEDGESEGTDWRERGCIYKKSAFLCFGGAVVISAEGVGEEA